MRNQQEDLAQHAGQAGRVAAAILAQEERSLLGTAHELATARGVEEALAGPGSATLRGELVAAQVSQGLALAAVVDRQGRQLAEANLPAGLLSQTRVVETATLLLDATTIEWIDEGAGEVDIFLLAAAVHRRNDGLQDGAVVVGREIDDRYLERLGRIVGAPVSIRLDGRTMGSETVPGTMRSTFGYRSLYGGDLQLLVHTPLAESQAVVVRGVLLVAGAGVLALLAFLVLSTVLVRRAVRPLDTLARVATRIAAGGRGERAPLAGAAEVIVTSRAFNTMVSALEARQDELARLYETEAATAAMMEFQALHDDLTRLPNRALFHDRLGQALAAADRTAGEVALLLMDLDEFKDVNDTYGHSVGDALLQQIGPRCGADLRQTDTFARLGGDEFAIILPGVGADAASRIGERVRLQLERPFLVAGHALRIGGSTGIAMYPLHAEDGEKLLARADVAMYAAKRSSGLCVYSSALERRPADRLETVAELRQLLEADGIELHYQPIVSLRSGRVDGVEALARWRHPARGWVPPSEFIPLAEQSGLIKALTKSVLRSALGQAVSWWQAGFTVPVGVNLSMRSLLDPDLCRMVSESLAEAGARPEMLCVEVTEGAMMADPERALASASELRAMGVRLSIDDFGSGYSSPAYLHKLHAHEVKIDRSFIAAMAANESSRTIVRVTIEYAKALGLAVVAGGVEDARTLGMLRSLGCDSAQGFLISRPIPAEDVLPWVGTLPSAGAIDLGSPAVRSWRPTFEH